MGKIACISSFSWAKLVEFAIFLVLLVTCSLLVRGTITQYLEGTKYFSHIKKNLTHEDLPTVTICLSSTQKLIFGRDFELQTLDKYYHQRTENTTVISLPEGTTYYYFDGNWKTLLRLMKAQHSAFSSKNCVSLDLHLYDEIYWDGNQFRLGFFIINISNNVEHKNLHQVYLHVTSKVNSYGAIFSQWHDGTVQHLKLQKGGFDSLFIEKISKYEYLKETCKHVSFYQCIGLKLNESKICQEKGTPCMPYSLPREDPLQDFQICHGNKTWNECNQHLQNMLESNICMGLKPCTVREYILQQNIDWSVKENNLHSTELALREFLDGRLVDMLLKDQSNKYMVWLGINKAKSGRGEYTNQVQKDIYKEYWTWTGITLVGNVGGHLGLFVGFSFTGTFAWMLSWVKKIGNSISHHIKNSETSQ